MDQEEKRKRTRKRVRKQKQTADENEGAAVQPVEQQGGPCVPVQSQEADPSPSATVPATTAASKDEQGPSLSFYQRTNPHKPSALASMKGAGHGRRYTVSIALPGSVIMNAQTPELQARLAGHIARSCAIFNIDEIVVFDEGKGNEADESEHQNGGRGFGYAARKRRWNDNDNEGQDEEQSYGQEDGQKRSAFDPNAFLARILQYVETPQYLRKALFPMHRDLRLAGLLAPLDCPHHLRFEDQSPYREGVCVEPPYRARDDRSKGTVCYVDVGLRDPIACTAPASSGADAVPIGARVTVRMPPAGNVAAKGRLVSPREPVEQKGIYWGYSVRLCGSFSEAVSNSTFGEPYDFLVGTSERGQSLTDLIDTRETKDTSGGRLGDLPSSFKHALVVLGGLSGLEVAVERDPNIDLSADEASQFFDAWVNVVEGQGSRTIRTEEALLITLARLKSTLESIGSVEI